MRLLHSRIYLFALLLLIATACNTDPQEDNATVTTECPEVVTRVLTDADVLNPLLLTVQTAQTGTEMMFQSLLSQNPFNFELEPLLVKSRAQSEEVTEGEHEGGVKYTFEFRKDAIWDDDSPITAEDYLFTLKAVFVPQLPNAHIKAILDPIADVITYSDNPKKISIITSSKLFSGEQVISNTVPVLPKYVYDPNGLLDDIPFASFRGADSETKMQDFDAQLQEFAAFFQSDEVNRVPGISGGSGPYELEEWIPGQSISFKRKDNWWCDRLSEKNISQEAYPCSITMKPIPDDATIMSAIKGGEVSIASGLAPKAFNEAKEDELITNQYEMHAPEVLAYYVIYVNSRKPMLADKKVRQALSHALNMDELIQKGYGGYGTRIGSPFHPSFTFYKKDLEPIPYNIEKAKQLLAEAGWEDTNNNGIVDKVIDGQRKELSLNYTFTAGRERSRNIALLLQNTAQQAGIEINLDPQEAVAAITRGKNAQYDLYGGGRALNPYGTPKQNWHTEGDNRTGFGNAETDQLIEQIEVTLDDKKRTELYHKLQDIIYDERVELLIMAPQERIVISNDMEIALTALYPGYVLPLTKMKEKN
ncbi:MAG: ABC transporter substrate-binding protein [Bacteroidota bacterium]